MNADSQSSSRGFWRAVWRTTWPAFILAASAGCSGRGQGLPPIENEALRLHFNAERPCLAAIENRLTGEVYPIAGDEKYGEPEFNERMKALGLERMFLHAHQLSFVWPETGVEFSASAPLPADLAGNVDGRGRCKPQGRARPNAALAHLDHHGHLRAARTRQSAQGREQDDGHGGVTAGAD